MRTFINCIFLFALLLSVGCSSDHEAAVKRSVWLYANDDMDITRTSFAYDEQSGEYSTDWIAGDAMRVLIDAAEAKAQDYIFTLQDAASGRFACDDVAVEATSVDAYGVYPSAAAINVEDCTATVEVGAAKQSQQGLEPAHVAEYDPLWGNQTQVGLDEIRLQMHHTAAVMHFEVKNLLESEVAVQSVKLYAPDVVAGEHTLDLQSGEMVATDNVSKTIELSLMDCTLRAGEQTPMWVAMSPFTVAAGEELKFVVTTENGKRYGYTKQFATQVEFPSGKVMKMSAPIELKEESLLAESINVAVDLAKAASYPDNFPTTKSVIEGVNDYLLGGYPFQIFSTKPYMRSGSNNSYRMNFYFNGESSTDVPTAEDYALVYLPKYDGYKISAVNITLASGNSNVFRMAIANSDNLEVSHEYSNSPSDPNFDAEEIAEMGADVAAQCCLYIHFNGSRNITKSNCNCFITNIEIDYVLE